MIAAVPYCYTAAAITIFSPISGPALNGRDCVLYMSKYLFSYIFQLSSYIFSYKYVVLFIFFNN